MHPSEELVVNAEDFEAGDEVEVEVASRAGAVVSIRLSAEEMERLSDVAEARGTTLSQVARDAVLAHSLESASSVSPLRRP